MKSFMGKMGRSMLVLLVITTVACRQQKGQEGRQQGPPPMPNDAEIVEMVGELSKSISLDESQETRVLELYQEHFKEMESKMESGRPDRDEMEALKSKFENAVNAVLTEEQQGLFKDYQKNIRRKERR